MLNFTIKTLKIGFWIFLPFLIVSSTGLDTSVKRIDVDSGRCEMNIKGEINQDINGVARFSLIQKSSGNKQVSTLKLKFFLGDSSSNEIVAFALQKNGMGDFKYETYRISKNNESFLDEFEGVFGFSVINALGEKPFFAKEGKIIINNALEKELKGSLDVSFFDANGREFSVEGDFLAIDDEAIIENTND